MRCLWSTVSLCRSLTEESVVVAASRTSPLCSATTASRHSSSWAQLGCSLQVQLDTSCWQLRPPAAEAGEEQAGAAVLLSELMLVSSQLPLELPASHSGHSAVTLASPGVGVTCIMHGYLLFLHPWPFHSKALTILRE